MDTSESSPIDSVRRFVASPMMLHKQERANRFHPIARMAELFFRLISQRYEHGSVILASNKYLSDWGELLSDNVLATVLLDRLLHHAHVLNIRGETYRLKTRLKTGVQTVPPTILPADR